LLGQWLGLVSEQGSGQWHTDSSVSACATASAGRGASGQSLLAEHVLTKKWWPAQADRQMLSAAIAHDVNCVASSAAGRYFDGVAALLGLCEHNDYEGQSGQMLEAAASEYASSFDADQADSPASPLPLFRLHSDPSLPGLMRLDMSALIGQLIAARQDPHDARYLAWLFHVQLSMAWEAAVAQAVVETGLECVVLSGGVFCNQLLTRLLSSRLSRLGLQVLRHIRVSPNDSGLAFGQAAVAAARLADSISNRPALGRCNTNELSPIGSEG
jgi:hydrogenase maturation protein HypF